MGSNPISPTIIFDTSPLQAIYRAGILPLFQNIFERTLVPVAVFEETQASLSLTASGRVPDLRDFGWIETIQVADGELESAGVTHVKDRRSTKMYRWFERLVDRPEVEAIILAKRAAGRALIEDRNGVKCAADFGVQVVSVADLLVELETNGHVGDARALATTIMATGYYSKELRWLSWRADREPSSE